MRLLIVDDHEVVRHGVRSLLSEQAGWVVCGEAVDGHDAIEKARELKPDLIVMDVSMPRLNGLEATRQVRNVLPGCEVVVLTQHENNEMARQALKAGARGYVVKSSISRDLISAIVKVSQGECFFDAAILNQTSPTHTDVQEILQRSAAFQKALQKSEQLYRSTFELAAVGVAHVSPEGKWLRVNKKLCQIVGYSEQELLNLTLQQITHPDDLPANLAQTAKLLNGTLDMFSMEKRYIRKDSSHVWVNLTVSCMRDDNGKPEHFITIVEDIDAKKHAQNALRESEERLQLAQQVANVGTFDWNIKTGLNRWTPELERMYGLAAGTFAGTQPAWEQLVHPDDREKVLSGVARALKHKNGGFEGQWRVTWSDGSVHWLFGRAWVIRDQSGEPERLIGVNVDITERKRVEEALEDSQKQLVLALESSKTAMFDWDVVQRRGSWNPQMAALYDLTPKGAYITAEEWTSLFHPADRARLAEEAERVWRGTDDQFTFEFRTIRRDGQIRWIISHGRVMRDSNGKAVRMIGTHTDISDNKQTEAATGLLASIVTSSDDAIVSKSLDGIIQTWNKGAERILGYTAEEAIGKHITLIIPPDRHAEEDDILARLRRGERIDHFQTVRRHKDGTLIDVSLTISPVRDSSGRIIGASKVARDITEQRRAEQASARLAAIVESSDDAIVSKNLDGIIQTWNKGAERILGYTAEDAIGKHITLIVPPDHRAEEDDILARLWRGERIDHYQTVRRHKDGRLIDVSLTISPVRDSSGRITGASKVARDITGEKRAEQALRESEQRYQAVTDASPVMIWVAGTDKLCYYFNKRWLDFVGRTLEQECGNGWAENVHPDDFDRCLQIYVSNFDSRRSFEMEYRIRHHSGQYRWIFDRGIPLYAPDGTFEGYVGACLDIHDRKEAAEKVRLADETVRLLKAQDEERRRIARDLHDSAGQTLTVLGLNLAQLVQKAEVVAPELAKEGKQIEEAVQQLHREIRTTSYLLHPPLLDEAGLSSALSWYVQGIADRSGMAIDLNISDDFERLSADMELAIFRVVQECLTNIHRHAESKTARISIARENGSVCIEVRDEGKGISPERMAEIQSRGSGVGIAGIRERLRQFGGTMTIESDKSGTRVVAKIPVPIDARSTDAQPLQAAV